MGNWFVKSFDNYFKFIDDDSSMIVLTSASLDGTGSDMVITFNHLSESVPKYEGIRDSFISSSYFTSSYTGSSNQYHKLLVNPFGKKRKKN